MLRPQQTHSWVRYKSLNGYDHMIRLGGSVIVVDKTYISINLQKLLNKNSTNTKTWKFLVERSQTKGV